MAILNATECPHSGQQQALAARVWPAALLLLLVLGLSGCVCPTWLNPRPGRVIVRKCNPERTRRELVTKRFKRLGISVDLPRDVMDLNVWRGQETLRLYGAEMVDFTLVRDYTGSMHLGYALFMRGTVIVYTPEGYQRWLEMPWESFGTRKTDAPFGVWQTYDLEKEFLPGLKQKAYRIDREGPGGKVLQVIIIRCDYSRDPTIIQADEDLIRRILESVRFLGE